MFSTSFKTPYLQHHRTTLVKNLARRANEAKDREGDIQEMVNVGIHAVKILQLLTKKLLCNKRDQLLPIR